MPSSPMWLRNKSKANYSKEAAMHQIHSRQGRVLGTPWKFHRTATKHSKPYSFPCINTHWVTHNQEFPFLTDAPKDRKDWANTSSSNFALRPNWAEWETKALAITQMSTQESWKMNHPQLPAESQKVLQTINACKKLLLFVNKNLKNTFFWCKKFILRILNMNSYIFLRIERFKHNLARAFR